MLTIPKSLCKCDDVVKKTSLTTIVPIAEYIKPEPIELKPIDKALCYCEPVPEIVTNFYSKPIKTKIVKTCFTDFIKNITSTKFCNYGPTCKVS